MGLLPKIKMNSGNGWYSPPPEEGWLRDQEKLRSYLWRADGVVRNVSDHPVRSYQRMPSAIFSWSRVHPSSGGGEYQPFHDL